MDPRIQISHNIRNFDYFNISEFFFQLVLGLKKFRAWYFCIRLHTLYIAAVVYVKDCVKRYDHEKWVNPMRYASSNIDYITILLSILLVVI